MTPKLETERLWLRTPEPADLEAHVAMMGHPQVARYLTPAGKPRGYGEEWRAFAAILGHWQIHGFGFFSVFEKSSGAWVGRVGPWLPGGWPGLEVGWSICHEHWGRGYATEAAIATVAWTFSKHTDLERIISVIDDGNVNSQAVANRIGERITGEVFEFAGKPLRVWAAPRAEWLARFGPPAVFPVGSAGDQALKI